MAEHTSLAGQLCSRLGAGGFVRPDPFDLVVSTVADHDAGWANHDADPELDQATGLPVGLFSAPLGISLAVAAASPTLHEARHPLAGLLVSMHSTGLYAGGWGLDRQALIDRLDPSARPAIESMLAYEAERRERLIQVLGVDKSLRSLAQPDAVMANYRCLQFCDSLALWLQVGEPHERTGGCFEALVDPGGRHVPIAVTPIRTDVVELDPWPFLGADVEVECRSRLIETQPDRVGLRRALSEAPPHVERIELRPGG